MADISSTGQGSTQNYFIGRGSVYLAELKDGTPQGWRNVGNVADLNVEADTSVIEHFSSQTFARTKDSEVISQLSLNFSITFDEWMYENLSEFFLGSTSTYDQTGGATVTPDAGSTTIGSGSQLIYVNKQYTGTDGPADRSVGGRYYDIYLTAGGDLVLGAGDIGLTHAQRVYKIDPSQLEIEITGGPVTEGNGWTYDVNTGQIFIEADGAIDADATGAADSDIYKAFGVEYNADLPSFSASEMAAITSDQKTLAVKFLAINGNVQGERHEIILHQVKIRPQGSLGLINEDEYGQITLEGSVERNPGVDPDGGGYVTIRKIS